MRWRVSEGSWDLRCRRVEERIKGEDRGCAKGGEERWRLGLCPMRAVPEAGRLVSTHELGVGRWRGGGASRSGTGRVRVWEFVQIRVICEKMYNRDCSTAQLVVVTELGELRADGG